MAMEKRTGPYELTPPGEISSRIIKLQGRMKEKGLELALLLQNVDVFYFTGTVQKGYLFIPQEGEAVFFVQKDYARATVESPLRCVKIESMKDLPNLLHEHGLAGKRIGMELEKSLSSIPMNRRSCWNWLSHWQRRVMPGISDIQDYKAGSRVYFL